MYCLVTMMKQFFSRQWHIHVHCYIMEMTFDERLRNSDTVPGILRGCV